MNRRGFTLLEVMLALALAALVLIAVATAIDVHLRVLDSGRTKVEEAQLARGLLRQIADDLRGAVLHDPKALEGITSATMSSAGLGGAASSDLQGMATQAGLDSADWGEDTDTDSTANLAESTVPQIVPGIYGNRYELMVDTSHLPRIDQYEGMSASDGSSMADRVSDVKTVTYFVLGNRLGGSTYGTGYGTTSLRGGAQRQTGLVRRELDRAITAWADQNGTLTEMMYDVEPLAPEVVAIEFLYFDGTEWLDEWDSDKRGGLPVAVEVGIAIAPLHGRQSESSPLRTASTATASDDSQLVTYHLLVHLPVAQPTTAEGTSGTEEETEESEGSAQGSQGAGDSGAGGGSGQRGGQSPPPGGGGDMGGGGLGP
jgi:prepilin-type N-terminal cleavage/methylation domain-containing protein